MEDCTNLDIEIHHIKKLQRKKEIDGKISVLDFTGKRVMGIAAILTSSNRKQLPLCRLHNGEFENGKFSKLNITFLKEIYNTKIFNNEILQELYYNGIYNFNNFNPENKSKSPNNSDDNLNNN